MNTKNTLTKQLFLFLILAMVAMSSYAQSLHSRVDRTTIGADETLTLTVRYTGSEKGQPDFSALNAQFEILNQSQSNQIRAVNGHVTSYTEWTMVIMPKESGRLVVPSFKFDGQFSDAIEIDVTKPAQLPPGVRDSVFIETVLDKPKGYVQEQFLLTYRLYFSENIDSLERNPDFTIDNVLIEKLDNSRYQKNVGGRPYQVVEFKYLLFPQISGNVEIPAQSWTAKMPRGGQTNSFFGTGRYQLKRLRTDAKTIEVHAQAEAFPKSATWLPSTDISLTESWSKPPSSFKVGEPITLKLTLKATGLMASQLPEILVAPTDPRVKIYKDQPQNDNAVQPEGYIGKRIESMAVVVSQGGDITIPAIKIPWWDTKTDSLRYAELPERKISVAATPGATAQPELPPSIPKTVASSTNTTVKAPTSKLWQILTIIFAFTTLIFAALWVYALSRIKNSPEHESQTNDARTTQRQRNEAQAWKQFLAVSKSNDKAKIKNALIEWGKARWPGNKVHSTVDLGRLCGDNNVLEQIGLLDSAMYAKQANDSWVADALVASIKQWRLEDTDTSKEKGLPSLYPQGGVE